MSTIMELTSNPLVLEKINGFPTEAKHQLIALRALVISTAEKTEELTQLEETLKWGEPSYLTKHGSTIRMNWSPKSPDRFGLYFQCTSSLISTFRTIYPQLHYEGNRAIIFQLNEDLPQQELSHCIQLALRYHKLKHLPLLGA